MKIEQLNEIMNCGCLQSVIENDKQRYTYKEDRLGLKTIFSANDGGINFNTRISFRVKKIKQLQTEVNGYSEVVTKDKNEVEDLSIPFLFCPICGTKTKHNIPEESFYHQFQNEQS